MIRVCVEGVRFSAQDQLRRLPLRVERGFTERCAAVDQSVVFAIVARNQVDVLQPSNLVEDELRTGIASIVKDNENFVRS